MVAQIQQKKPNIITRFRHGIRSFLNPPIEKNFPLPMVWHMVNTGSYQWHMIDYEAYAKDGYSQNAVIYGAIKYKLDAIAQAPMRAYEGTIYKAEISENENHPLYLLAQRPNEYQSHVEFMQYNELYLNLHGNSFIYLLRGENGLPIGMYPLRPDRVAIVPMKSESSQQSRVTIRYAYFPDGMSKDKMIPIPSEDMLHIKYPNPYDPLEGLGYGLSPLSAGAFSADTDNYMTKFLGQYFKNQGIMPGGVIQLPYDSNPEDIATLREQIGEVYGGAGNWGKPLVIDGGGTFSHMVPSFKDMGLEGIDLRNVRRITTVFGVPGRLIGLDEANSTYNNLSEAKEDFWQNTMNTELKLFEEEFRHKVTIGDQTFLRFDVSGIPAFADDTAMQVQTYKELVGNFVPPHTAARIAGLDIGELEHGDESFMPTSLVPVSIGMQPPPQPQPFGGGTTPKLPVGQGESEDDKDDIPNEESPQKFLDDGTPVYVAPLDGATYGSNHDGIDDGLEVVHYSTPITTKNRLSRVDKEALRDNLFSIMASHEPTFEKAAKTIFKRQKATLKKRLDVMKRLSLKSKKSFAWMEYEQWARMYLFSGGLTEVHNDISPLVATIASETRTMLGEALDIEDLISDFDTMFVMRSSIEAEAWFANYSLKFAKDINETTFEGIHAIIRDGLEAEMGTDEIGNMLGKLFDQYMNGGQNPEDWEFYQERMPAYRLEMIARTETHGAVSTSNHYLYRRIGATKKEWLATQDGRTRESHLAAERRYTEGGEIGAIPIDDKFIVGGIEMLHPGDKSAPLKEFINCRCVEIPFIPEVE